MILNPVFTFCLSSIFQVLYSVNGKTTIDTLQLNDNADQNGWTIYLVSLVIMIVLFFAQKYAYLIDRKLSRLMGAGFIWEGKPWPLFAGLILGIFTLLYNVFSPVDMHLNPLIWRLPEWILAIAFVLLFIALAIESISHFGKRIGIIRFLIIGVLVISFYFSGLFVGLLIVAFIAIIVLIYFIKFWRKKLIIK